MVIPRVLIITSCTGEKKYKVDNQLTLEDFKNAHQLERRESELNQFLCSASKLYTGKQHLQLMEGIQTLRDKFGQNIVTLNILSAGYGLISEDQIIAPYEVTFNGMTSQEVNAWAMHLGVHEAINAAIKEYDLIFFLLGDNYLRALSLPIETSSQQTLIFLASRERANSIRGMSAKTYAMPLSNPEAKKYHYGLVGLKGYIFKHFADAVIANLGLLEDIYVEPKLFADIINSQFLQREEQLTLIEILNQIPNYPSAQVPKIKKPTKIVDNEDILKIPDTLPAPNQHLGMKYFIPEWDDRVYPNYDFIKDESPGRQDFYKDDVYAHEIYPSPNYDGILISKIVIDESTKQRKAFESVGVHQYVRFQGEIMGDCGAFGYVEQEIPPYETDEILDYYQRLGFNYGVSIDHLIVGPFAKPGIREMRYELTLKNAQEFLEQHRKHGYSFTPIGVVQGWDPESYANAVQKLIKIGYDFIAIGGLARAQNREIIPILKAIYPHVESHVHLHLFGVARIEAIPIFRHLGVTSFDSSGPLRQAWLSSEKNYHTVSGKYYMAARVPPSHGNKVKKLLATGQTTPKELEFLEHNTLRLLRDFEAGKAELQETLDALVEYNDVLDIPKEGDSPTKLARLRNKRRVLYQELLLDRPWEQCQCPICQEIGIEVVIFRNNNRNRRRGFHNTYAFYQRFLEIINRD